MSGAKRIAYASSQPRHGMRNLAVCVAVVGAQLALLTLLSLATGSAYHVYAYGDAGDLLTHAVGGALVGIIFIGYAMPPREQSIEGYLYRTRSPAQIVLTWNIAFFVLGAVAFLAKTTASFSRGWVVLYYIGGLVLVLAFDAVVRMIVARGVANGTIPPRRIMLIGTRAEINSFSARMSNGERRRSNPPVCVISTLAFPDTITVGDVALLSRLLEQGVAKARALLPDDVVILSRSTQSEFIQECLVAFSNLPVTIRLDGGEFLDPMDAVTIGHCGHAATVLLSGPPLTPIEAVVKRVCDIVLASFLVVISAPILFVIALAIKVDSAGPVFFRQRRLGFNQSPFTIWKFRTMSVMDDGDVIRQAQVGDQRITRVGRVLRRTNLDELPQLFNVLIGNMSLVGPRPHAVAHDRDWGQRVRRYPRRLNVKPGITGWAQINGYRGELDTDEKLDGRVSHDLYYIEHWSISFDLYILAMTVISPRAFCNAR